MNGTDLLTTSHSAEAPAGAPSHEAVPHLLRSIPATVWLVGLLAAVIHMVPYWRAASETPDDWTFTANLSASPDYMQYRVWSRQTQDEGMFVSNRFTTEPNNRHLPVALYWAVGRTASVVGLTPEWTYAWLGAVFAVVFVIALFLMVRHFLPGPRATAWVFGVLLVGGGLGGYLRYMEQSGRFSSGLFGRLFVEPLRGPTAAIPFENYRGNYIVQALFDTHFLVFWLISTVAVASLYLTVRKYSLARLALTCALFGFGTFLHVYEGITLLFIAAGSLLFCWRKGLPGRTALVIGFACVATVGLFLVALAGVFRQSGLPTPTWRGLNVLPSVVLLAYPAAWMLILWGGVRFWTRTGIDGAFLVGWAVGCLTLITAAPFFPYPDRGTMTLQIPLYLIAGSIFFSRRTTVGPAGVLGLALLLGSTTVWVADRWLERTTFNDRETHKWMSPEHVAMAAALNERAGRDDVLLAGEVPLRWLAPEFRGRHYAGHFFLTVAYDRKQERLRQFYARASPAERESFLREEGVRFVYVEGQDTAGIATTPGLRPLRTAPFGALLEYVPEPLR